MKPYFESDETNSTHASIVPFSSVAYIFVRGSLAIAVYHSTSTNEKTVLNYHNEDTLTSQLNNYKAYLQEQHHANHLD